MDSIILPCIKPLSNKLSYSMEGNAIIMYAEAECIFHVSTLSTCRKIYDQFHGIMLIDWNILVDRIIYISIA